MYVLFRCQICEIQHLARVLKIPTPSRKKSLCTRKISLKKTENFETTQERVLEKSRFSFSVLISNISAIVLVFTLFVSFFRDCVTFYSFHGKFKKSGDFEKKVEILKQK